VGSNPREEERVAADPIAPGRRRGPSKSRGWRRSKGGGVDRRRTPGLREEESPAKRIKRRRRKGGGARRRAVKPNLREEVEARFRDYLP